MTINFLVVIEKGLKTYSAKAPDLPGCIAAGQSVEDAIEMMRSAIEFHLAGIVKKGEVLPNPLALTNFVRENRDVPDGVILTGIDAEMPQAV